jgi:hypothetical protein
MAYQVLSALQRPFRKKPKNNTVPYFKNDALNNLFGRYGQYINPKGKCVKICHFGKANAERYAILTRQMRREMPLYKKVRLRIITFGLWKRYNTTYSNLKQTDITVLCFIYRHYF